MGTGSQNNDFVVNSKEHCFFCLSKTSFKSAPEKESSSSSSLHTLQCLSQYLKLDMTRVFSQKGSIPDALLDKVKQSRLKVELCEECAGLAKRFSVRFQKWEKMEMDMLSELSRIQEKMEMAQTLEQRFVQSEGNEGIKEVLQVLRMETIEKCIHKIGNPAPRIKIQKLSMKAVNTFLTNKNSKKLELERTTDTRFTSQAKENVKAENQTDDVPYIYVKDGGVEAFLDDMVGFSEEDDDSMEQTAMNTTTGGVSDDGEEESFNKSNDIVMPSTSGNSGELKYIINPETGKYRCKLCSKEFMRRGFDYHYKSVHLNIRYKCNLCGKIFARKPGYNTHLRKAHLGVTYKCLVCNREFKYKLSLNKHLQKNMCKAGNV